MVSDPFCSVELAFRLQLTRCIKPFKLIDVFNPLVYGPMTLVILGFTEAASRRREHRLFYTVAAAVIAMIILGEVGWSARGVLSCGGDQQCTALQEVRTPSSSITGLANDV